MWCWCGIKFLKGGHWEEISSCKENKTGAFWDGRILFHATKIVAWCLMCFLAGSVPSAVARKTRSAKICGGTGEDRTTPGQNCIRLRSGTQFADHQLPSFFTSNCLFPRQWVFCLHSNIYWLRFEYISSVNRYCSTQDRSHVLLWFNNFEIVLR